MKYEYKTHTTYRGYGWIEPLTDSEDSLIEGYLARRICEELNALQAERDALLTEVSDLREKVRYFEDTVCCPDMRVMLSNGCSTMAIDPERVADLVRERDRLRQTAGKAAPDIS